MHAGPKSKVATREKREVDPTIGPTPPCFFAEVKRMLYFATIPMSPSSAPMIPNICA